MAFSYNVNFQTTSEGNAWWKLKELLVAGGWSVARSGDGLSAYSSSGDVLSAGGPYPTSGANSLDNTSAWMELWQNSSIFPRRSILIQKTSTAGAWRIWYSSSDTYKSGVGDSFAFSSPNVTLTDSTASFVAGDVGKYVLIQGATSAGNNGLFAVTAQGGTTLTWSNSNGVAEAFTGTWKLISSDGFKWGVSGTGDSFSNPAGSTYRLTDAGASFVAGDVGKTLRITGATSAGNNGDFVITAQTGTTVDFTNTAGVVEAFSGTWYINRDTTSTTRGIASDEQGIVNTPSGTTIVVPSNIGGVFFVDTIVGGSAEGYSFFFGVRRPSTQGYGGVLALDVLAGAHAFDTDPGIIISAFDGDTVNFATASSGGASGPFTTTLSQSTGGARGWYKKLYTGAAFVSYPIFGWGNQENTLNNYVPRSNARNSQAGSNDFQEIPCLYMRGGSSITTERGYKGRSQMFRSLLSAIGQHRNNVGRTRMSIGAISIPWDGSTAPLF